MGWAITSPSILSIGQGCDPLHAKATLPPAPVPPLFPMLSSLQSRAGNPPLSPRHDIHQHHFWSHLRRGPTPPQAANPHKAPRWAWHDKQAPRSPQAPPGVLGGAEAGFSAAVSLSVRASNWIPNTQRSAETLGREESKGRGTQEIKRGILPMPQRRQREGWKGTPERGCPVGGARTQRAGGRAREAKAEGPAFLQPGASPPLFPWHLGLGNPPALALGKWGPLRPDLSLPREGFLEGSRRPQSQLDLGPNPGFPPVRFGQAPATLWPQFPPLWNGGNRGQRAGQDEGVLA